MHASGYQRMTDRALQVFGEKTPPPRTVDSICTQRDIGVVL